MASHLFYQPPSADHVYTIKVLTFCDALQQRLHSKEVRLDSKTMTVVDSTVPKQLSLDRKPSASKSIGSFNGSTSSGDGSSFAVSELLSPRSQHLPDGSDRIMKRMSQSSIPEQSNSDEGEEEGVEILDAADNAIDDLYASVQKKSSSLKGSHQQSGDVIRDPLLQTDENEENMKESDLDVEVSSLEDEGAKTLSREGFPR